MNWTAAKESDLPNIASEIINSLKQNIVVFKGEMGAGKTTLIKELCNQLNVMDNTSSPTFSIVNQYLSSEDKTIFHFDFYRIDDEREVMDMGYEDYFFSGAYCFIEWAEKIPNLLPENYDLIKISVDSDNNRLISVASQ